MKNAINRQIVLAARPVGEIGQDVLRLVERPVPKLAEGEALVRNQILSIDPTNRIWMNEEDSYLPAVQIGEIMRGITAGQVVESRSDLLKPGDLVTGLGGYADYWVGQGQLMTKLPGGVSLEASLSVFGHIGLTAYFGLLEVGKAASGETVVVSAGAGATGSLVGQIAKIKGCRVVATVGTEEKRRWVVEQLGFDQAIVHRANPDLRRSLELACPSGIDVFFDNVGGEVLDAALSNLALYGRVVLCGAISQYNNPGEWGPKNYGELVVKRGRMEGFIVMDYHARAAEAFAALSLWLKEGRLQYRAEVIEGLENAPLALQKLFRGENRGKLLVRISS